jgi:dolichol-phosphate mannosyltransferase
MQAPSPEPPSSELQTPSKNCFSPTDQTLRAVVVVPTYNERENLPELVRQIRRQRPPVHILFVDDGSPDGTGQLADEYAANHPGEIHVLHRSEKAGLGRAYVAGFRKAIELGYDLILQMDADLSHDPEVLPQFCETAKISDLVIGSRYSIGINIVGWSLKRLALSQAGSKYVQTLTGLPFKDLTGGFKCWRRQVLQQIPLEEVIANGYLFQIEMTYRAYKLGARIIELPIIFYERQSGASKMHIGIVTEALLGVPRLIWKIKRGRGR